MNATETHRGVEESPLDSFAAELTEAAVPVALRYGVGDRWLDLELDLWHVMAETVEKWRQPSPVAPSSGNFKAPRKGLLAKLTDAAYHTTLRHGERGAVSQAKAGLYLAFRSAMRDTVGACA